MGTIWLVSLGLVELVPGFGLATVISIWVTAHFYGTIDWLPDPHPHTPAFYPVCQVRVRSTLHFVTLDHLHFVPVNMSELVWL